MNNQNNDKFNNLILRRFPVFNNETLRAWDAADEYLLDTLNKNNQIKSSDNILVFNDSFGALSINILHHNNCNSITVVTDSIISKNGIKNNCKINNIDTTNINIINSLENLIKIYDYVIIKSPKSLDYLLFFLSNIQQHIDTDCQILIAGMVKHLPKNLWITLEQNFGSTQTSLAVKKAKIIALNYEKNNLNNNYPSTFKHEEFAIYNHASVFSKNSIDVGTRFLLQHLTEIKGVNEVIDLGCGNGIVGLYLANLYPKAQITLTDESYMAVASAKLTLEKNLDSLDSIKFIVNNCLDDFENNSVDLIVCNPPFHQSQNVGIQIALTMFTQSFKTLRKNGHLIVIANRHLPYFIHLKRIFGSVKNLASNAKFVIYLLKKQ